MAMFGSTPTNPFGQNSATRPFGSGFGCGGANTNSFAQNSFGVGSPSPFGSLSGSSPFAQNSFGSGSPNTFGSQPFGGTSTGIFGQASTISSGPVFGVSPPVGGSTQLGKNAIFGSTTSGSAMQQTQSTFGSNTFGLTKTFGTSGFGGTSGPPAFGTSLAFGSTSRPPFGAATPGFSTTTSPAFGLTTTPAFGGTTNPASGFTSFPTVGSTTSVFNSTGTSCGVSNAGGVGPGNTSAFGHPSSQAFGVTSAPLFGSPTPLGTSTPSSGQPQFIFGGGAVGTTSSLFSTQSSSSSAQTQAFTFGNRELGQKLSANQQKGSRVAKHTVTQATEEVNGTCNKLDMQSITAMLVYKQRSHEELRWEDYRNGDKGGSSFGTQPGVDVAFPPSKQTSPFNFTGQFGQTNGNPSFNATPATNPTITSPDISNSTPTTSAGVPSFSTFSPSTFSFPSSTSPLTPTTPTRLNGLFTPTSLVTPTPLPCFNNPPTHTSLMTASSPSIFASITPSFSTPPNGETQTLLGRSVLRDQNSSISNPNISITPTPSPLHATQQTVPLETSNYLRTPQVPTTSLWGTSSTLGQETSPQLPLNQTYTAVQPVTAPNPYGILPATTQTISSRISVQYGISSMPISEKPMATRISTLSAPRHLSQRRITLPLRKYNAKIDGPKVPFFMDGETQTSPKADPLFIPRENPRLLVVRPTEQWSSRAGIQKQSVPKDMNNPSDENVIPAGNDNAKEQNGCPLSPSAQKVHGVSSGRFQTASNSSCMTSDSDLVSKQSEDIEALLPKIHQADYYTEPQIQELATKERAEPGFCCRVKDFVVGRHGYGCIKFHGETDVRGLDLESIIQFNNREVIVYADASHKPPVGQGLNKPAEVTLLNIKYLDKKTGLPWTEGWRVEKFKEMLVKKAQKQGAEFLSFDAVRGSWKFNVAHF